MTALKVQGLVKRFGGLLVTDHVDLEIAPGELHAVIGPNGAGKTTLINLLSGELAPSAGRIELEGRDVTSFSVDRRARAGVARSFQIASLFADFTALQNVMAAVQATSGHSFSFWRPVRSDRRLVEPALERLAEVGLADQAHAVVASMAHGARRQLEIAMTLAMRPRLLLLDEPMAGMSQRESAAVVELLHRLKGRYAILIVEHDMDAVFALADRISVLVYGKRIVCGSVDEIRAHPEVRRAYLGDEEPDLLTGMATA